MEPNIPQGENIVHNADLDLLVSNLSERFAGIGRGDNIPQGPFDDAVIVIFDLDTTDLSRSKQICQISARCNNNIFNQYIIPDRDISQQATAIHGIEIRNERRLYHNGNEVNALGPLEGLTRFLDFLSEQTGQVLLAAHNCFAFDGSAIIREMKRHELLDTFQSYVLGFVDTLRIFPLILPECQEVFNLETLARDYLNVDIILNRHAAVHVEILVSLITEIGCTDGTMKEHAMELNVYIRSLPENVEERIADLAPLTNTVSRAMRIKINNAGISMDLLNNTYQQRGADGVSMLLRGNIEGIPRVTNRHNIINSIINKLHKLSLIDHENAIAN